MAPERATTADRLTDEAAAEVMRLLRGADSVELKATIPGDAHRATIRGLPLDPVEAQPRQVFFFDTPDLALDAAGLVVRARRIQGGRGDTVVKLRPAAPDELSAEVRRSAGFNVEVDVLPGGFVCSASFKGKATGQEVRDVLDGRTPLRKLFSKEQRAWYTQQAPAGVSLDDLVPLGPTFVLKTSFPVRTGGPSGAQERSLVAEMWLYPDGSRILELSTKCRPTEAFQVGMEVRTYLSGLGVPITGGQQTKTRAALDFYRAELAAQPDARGSIRDRDRRWKARSGRPEALGQEPVPQAAVADKDPSLAQQLHDGPHDTGAREDDLCSFRLQPDDRTPGRSVACAVELDLTVDLGKLQHGTLDALRIVRFQPELDGGEVRHRPAHPHERVRRGSAVDPGEPSGDVQQRFGHGLRRRLTIQPEALGVARRARRPG